MYEATALGGGGRVNPSSPRRCSGDADGGWRWGEVDMIRVYSLLAILGRNQQKVRIGCNRTA